ncbi:iron complex transport system ATP-binding protein [Melghirimyces profundicolus]|uniref:Iron complex transport system ATP-binding protein n=1 Tax=Melghirimyces profundicolus TaxID=1242148 RepID=A0A2T6B617_9BACL|nr:heme ABC transporter ATP-binding protein [Melghirimyces profundicolus]PTX51482.1 iron complex transport system ATP-binding protein [Melghirimyces profundicolus]
MLKARNLWKAYRSRHVLRGLGVSVAPGEMVGVIGPNGSGKTTLIRLLSGEERPDRGTVFLDGEPISKWSGRERAARLAVLPQEGLPSVPFTVEEVVSMGRHPHQSFWPWAGSTDRESVERALSRSGLARDRTRRVDRLSGGERQRVAIAKAMAQEPKVLLLDEPTTYLDIAHQQTILDRIQQWQREEGLAVLVVLHDLNLASQYCDRLLLMKEGARWAEGPPEKVLTPSRLREVYGVEPVLTRHPVTGVPQVLPAPGNQNPSRGAGAPVSVEL